VDHAAGQGARRELARAEHAIGGASGCVELGRHGVRAAERIAARRVFERGAPAGEIVEARNRLGETRRIEVREVRDEPAERPRGDLGLRGRARGVDRVTAFEEREDAPPAAVRAVQRAASRRATARSARRSRRGPARAQRRIRCSLTRARLRSSASGSANTPSLICCTT
jgi:hypothetical protein